MPVFWNLPFKEEEGKNCSEGIYFTFGKHYLGRFLSCTCTCQCTGGRWAVVFSSSGGVHRLERHSACTLLVGVGEGVVAIVNAARAAYDVS